jgi:hypothetical protein
MVSFLVCCSTRNQATFHTASHVTALNCSLLANQPSGFQYAQHYQDGGLRYQLVGLQEQGCFRTIQVGHLECQAKAH